MMAGALARNDPALDRLREGLSGRLPSPLARLEIEQALDHPGRARPQGRGALGEPQRGAPIAGAQRLVEEAAQPEKLGLGPVEHRGEEFLGRRLVALELGRLGRQQQGQRRVGEQRIGPCGA